MNNEYNNKIYYWIKLNTDFFNNDAIDFLMQQKNGSDYVVLYQMLCLKTANNGGKLESRINEIIIPYDPEKIQRDTKYFELDTIIVAMELYAKLGLIYKEENGTLKISNFEKFIGSITQNALYKKEKRELENVQQDSNKRLDIEYRDKELYIEEEKDIEKDIKEKTNKKETTVLTHDELVRKIVSDFKDIDLQNKFIEYAEMRKAKGKRFGINTIGAYKVAVDTLNRIGSTQSERLQILEESIINSWQGLFPLKNQKQQTQSKEKNTDLKSALGRLSNG